MVCSSIVISDLELLSVFFGTELHAPMRTRMSWTHVLKSLLGSGPLYFSWKKASTPGSLGVAGSRAVMKPYVCSCWQKELRRECLK